jgi:hypothetical protein
MRLKIRYRSSDDQLSDRVISDIKPELPNCLDAYCELRKERRTFVASRIESAIHAETGEVIGDIGQYLGLASTVKPPPSLPVFRNVPTPLPFEEAKRLRGKDKAALFACFRYPVIMEIAHRRLFGLFRNQCFKCGSPHDLYRDHHVPQYLGGRLVPGNIVILCTRCNGLKLDRSPELFYTQEEMAALLPLLEAQLQIFDFQLDWNRWSDPDKRASYLLSLGGSDDLVEEAMNDRDSPFYAWQDRDREEDNFSADTPDGSDDDRITDPYGPIRSLLDDYKTELQVLLAMAKSDGPMRQSAKIAILEFFRRCSSSFSSDQAALIERYIKTWGEESERGFLLRCQQLDRSRTLVIEVLLQTAAHICEGMPNCDFVKGWNTLLRNTVSPNS